MGMTMEQSKCPKLGTGMTPIVYIGENKPTERNGQMQ